MVSNSMVDLERKRERGLVIEANSILRRQEPTTQPKPLEVCLRFVYFAEIENFLFKIR